MTFNEKILELEDETLRLKEERMAVMETVRELEASSGLLVVEVETDHIIVTV
jgi:hypothetical protein